MYDKETLEKKRRQVRELYKKKTLNKKEIAKRLGVSWNFVYKWTEDLVSEISDQRGWPLGKKRAHTDQEELRLIMIRRELEKSSFFYGAGKMIDEYQKRFPGDPQLNKTFVNRVISKNFPMSRRSTLKAIKEQKYPIRMMSSLGDIQEEADFLGQKYIHGRTAPIHFFTRVYKNPFTLRLIKRVPDQGSETILDTFTQDWKVYPLPDILSIDNGFGFTAAGRGKRYISSFIQCMLRLGVAPLFIAPKKPWMNGSVEGTHSVFARKVWNKFDFKNLEEIDETVARFQEAYRQYTKTPNALPGRTLDEDFNWQDMFCTPFQPQDGMCIYLIRLVQEYQKDQLEFPAFRLFKDLVEMDKQFINTYVLVKLDVYREQLFIYVEPDQDGQKLVMEKDWPLHFAKMRY